LGRVNFFNLVILKKSSNFFSTKKRQILLPLPPQNEISLSLLFGGLGFVYFIVCFFFFFLHCRQAKGPGAINSQRYRVCGEKPVGMEGSSRQPEKGCSNLFLNFVAIIIGRIFSQIWLQAKNMKSIISKILIYIWLPT
jgi:hypothetical protein